MTSDIRSILSRLTALESQTTPAAPKIKGLNPQQKSADQLPALFQPKKITALGNKTDPAHPMKGMAVGASESRLAEMMQNVEEDMLGKVKRDFVDYLERLEDKIKTDPDLKDKAKREIKQELETAAETVDELESQPSAHVIERPVKSCTMEDGAVLEIYGDESRGFEIRNQGRILPTRFDRLDDADIAVKLFQKRRAARNTNQDYIDEA
jgi:prolyl-tRNA synthetase